MHDMCDMENGNGLIESEGGAGNMESEGNMNNREDLNGKFDTFIFDLDGTLLDTVPDLVLLTNRILREVSAPEHTYEEILSYVGSGIRRLIYLALPPDSDEEVVDRAMDLWNQWFMDYYHNTVAFPGIPEMLSELRCLGCGIGVVSNKLQPGVDVVIDKVLPDKIDVMFGESDRIPRKPNPKGIEIAMKELDASPESTIYIGDSPGDIRAGRNAGVTTCAVLWGYHEHEDFVKEDAEPDIYVEHPSQLIGLAKHCND